MIRGGVDWRKSPVVKQRGGWLCLVALYVYRVFS